MIRQYCHRALATLVALSPLLASAPARADVCALSAGVYSCDYTGGSGIFTVPVAGFYLISVTGANGGGAGSSTGGFGGFISGVYPLQAGAQFGILVGGAGQASSGGPNQIYGGGGGGASVIALYDQSSIQPYTPFLIAGGGGGAGNGNNGLNALGPEGLEVNGVTVTAGAAGAGGSNGDGGTGGNGGAFATFVGGGAGGGGFYTFGGNAAFSDGGASFIAGGAGGSAQTVAGDTPGPGGLGGGGGGGTSSAFSQNIYTGGGGGGGGYSGGGGGGGGSGLLGGSGGGGGGGDSYAAGGAMQGITFRVNEFDPAPQGNGVITFQLTSGLPSEVPEPATGILLASGLAALAAVRRRGKMRVRRAFVLAALAGLGIAAGRNAANAAPFCTSGTAASQFFFQGSEVICTIPTTGRYTIVADGGNGGAGSGGSEAGGIGASVAAVFQIAAGTDLIIAVGGPGGFGFSVPQGAQYAGGGGGASSVVMVSGASPSFTYDPLVIAAGGGGGGTYFDTGGGNGLGVEGTKGISGGGNGGGGGAGGTGGNGGDSTSDTVAGAGGAGFKTDGNDGPTATGGKSFFDGWLGGTPQSGVAGGAGGFGGGGAAGYDNGVYTGNVGGGGGGGGYSGGGGGGVASFLAPSGGGGGGGDSYAAPGFTDLVVGLNTHTDINGQGFIIIQAIDDSAAPIPEPPTFLLLAVSLLMLAGVTSYRLRNDARPARAVWPRGYGKGGPASRPH